MSDLWVQLKMVRHPETRPVLARVEQRDLVFRMSREVLGWPQFRVQRLALLFAPPGYIWGS